MSGRRMLLIALLVLGIQIIRLPQAIGQLQSPIAQEPVDEAPVDSPKKQPAFPSPHATLTTFLNASKSQDWKKAATCLDFSQLPSDLSQTARNDLAFKLKEIIDRLAVVDVRDFPTDPSSTLSYSIPRGDPWAPIRIAPDDDGNWVFTAGTVAKIEDLYTSYRNMRKVSGQSWIAESFRKMSPDWLDTAFLIPNYQWLCLLLLIPLGFVADVFTRLCLRHATAAWLRLAKSDDRRKLGNKLWKPMGLLAQALTWYVGTLLIGLPPMALTILLVAVKFFAVAAGVWTAFYLIDGLAAQLAVRASKTRTKFDDLLVPMISRSLKALAVVVGLLMCAETFNLPITGLVGGMGIGGAALAFASKDAVSNIFGSVTVMTDRPFEVGDWILTEGVEGTVERVGFRSTRIRTFYDSQITLPNSRLTTAVVDNMGRRRYRRVKTMLGFQYDTKPEQLEAICEGIRELIRRHPYTRKDYYHVYFNAFGASALEVLIYCFLECPDWSIELREKQRLYMDIMRLADSVGASFAFPTRTVHLFNEQHAAEDLPFDGTAAASTGQRLAAEIAGPLAAGDQRPGPVEFPGPCDAPDSANDGETAARSD